MIPVNQSLCVDEMVAATLKEGTMLFNAITGELAYYNAGMAHRDGSEYVVSNRVPLDSIPISGRVSEMFRSARAEDVPLSAFVERMVDEPGWGSTSSRRINAISHTFRKFTDEENRIVDFIGVDDALWNISILEREDSRYDVFASKTREPSRKAGFLGTEAYAAASYEEACASARVLAGAVADGEPLFPSLFKEYGRRRGVALEALQRFAAIEGLSAADIGSVGFMERMNDAEVDRI